MALLIIGLFIGTALGLLIGGLCASASIDDLMEQLDCEREKR